MARIRSIKPDFFKSETVSKLPLDGRLLFIGLLGIADDEGRAKDRPKLISSEIFPYDDGITVERVDALMWEMQQIGLIKRYEIDEKHYFHVTHFSEHQRINRPTTSSLPPPEDGSLSPHGGLSEDSVRTHAPLMHPSRTPHAVVTGGGISANSAQVVDNPKIDPEDDHSGGNAPTFTRDYEPTHGGLSEDSVRTHGGLTVGIRNKEGNKEGNKEVATLNPPQTTPKNVIEVVGASTEAQRCADLLAELITANGSKPPRVTQAWVDEVDRMHRLDGRSWLQIEGAIRWSQDDDFWRSVILSPKNLRKKFDQLRLQAKRSGKKSTNTVSFNAIEELLAEAKASEGEQ